MNVRGWRGICLGRAVEPVCEARFHPESVLEGKGLVSVAPPAGTLLIRRVMRLPAAVVQGLLLQQHVACADHLASLW